MAESANPPVNQTSNKGILGWIERTGNKLPDPVFIFFYLIIALAIFSVIAALFGYAVPHPTKVDAATGEPEIIRAVSLLSAVNIQRLLVEMPQTLTHFHPLGYVMVVMLGAGVAERTGLFASAMRASVRNAPKFLLTPMVALIAMVGNHAADAAYVVLIPLAAVMFAAAGRHPIAGIAASFAGVSGGFSANLFPGQLDALLFGITAEGAEALQPAFEANIAGNWYFIAGMTAIYLPIIWFVTDAIIEPRLGGYTPQGSAAEMMKDGDEELNENQKKGLRHALYATLGVIALWIFLTVGPGTPLIDEAADPAARMSPFYKSLVAGFFVLFLAAGAAYGRAAGNIKTHRDLVQMMAGAMGDLAYYFVLAFAAAHFVEMFKWSNLGLIFAVQGAGAIESSGLPLPATLGLLVLLTGVINLFVGSASAKWALLAPVLVPMLMLLGISPEMTTAAYRVGDSATNIITPLMVYFPLILTFCQRWQPEFGLGSLTATMVPYSIFLMISGVALVIAWVAMGLPLAPGVTIGFELTP